MKKRALKISSIVGVVIIILIALIFFRQTENPQKATTNEYEIAQIDFVDGKSLIESIPKSELNQDEIDGLILMREEEKLARDVYLALGEKWGTKIFSNIANSEQTHTNAVKILIERYGIEDPVLTDKIGIFTSPELRELYNILIEKGSMSNLDAFIVGAQVEDLDIKDLSYLLKKADNEDIIITYENLQRGSRNHLRAYVKQITKNNGEYIPEYISQEEYNLIITSSQEKGAGI